MNKVYAGIGSRSTPAFVQAKMAKIASRLCSLGFVLRSGGAQGADAAFESAVPAATAKQVFLPWKGFNGNSSPWYSVCDRAMDMARNLHPVFDALSPQVQKLMARSCYQVLGPDLDDPVAFVVCWTPDGCESERERSAATGGTGLAIALASRCSIPVFNLQRSDALDRLRAHLMAMGAIDEAPRSVVAQTPAPSSGFYRFLAAQAQRQAA